MTPEREADIRGRFFGAGRPQWYHADILDLLAALDESRDESREACRRLRAEALREAAEVALGHWRDGQRHDHTWVEIDSWLRALAAKAEKP